MKHVKRLSLNLLLLASSILLRDADAITFQGTVVDVPGGNMVVVEDRLRKKHEVKLLGMEAPAPNSIYSNRARSTLAQLTLQKDVIVQWTRFPNTCAKKQKLANACPRLGKVMVNGKDIGLEMLYQGLAMYFLEKKTDLDAEERDRYTFAERDARSGKLGLWEEKSLPQLQKENKPAPKVKSSKKP